MIILGHGKYDRLIVGRCVLTFRQSFCYARDGFEWRMVIYSASHSADASRQGISASDHLKRLSFKAEAHHEVV